MRNVREDILPPYHVQIMRSMNFQKMFILSVRFHQYRSFKSKLLNSLKIVLSIIIYFIAGMSVHAISKDQAIQTVEPGIVKYPSVNWIGTPQTYSVVEYRWEAQEASTVFFRSIHIIYFGCTFLGSSCCICSLCSHGGEIQHFTALEQFQCFSGGQWSLGKMQVTLF